MDGPGRGRVRAVLALGLLCVSFSAILVRFSDAGALATAFWRKALAALILLPLVVARRGREPFDWRLHGSLAPYTLGTGLLLAVHFGAWFASLKLISVASSLLFIATSPVWAAILGRVFLKDRVSARGAAGILLAIAGIAVIAGADLKQAGNLWGDALALTAAVAAAGYLTVGRHLRERVPLCQYLLVVYAVAAAALAAAAVAAGQPLWGYDGRTWVMLGVMAVFPSTLGHNLLNYAVRHMAAYRVSLATLVEPVVSTILAALLLSEIPPLLFYPGALFVFAGVVLALWGKEGSVDKVVERRSE